MSATQPHSPVALTKGMHVTDSSGKQIGTVGAVNETSFKVDAPMARDYWLPRTVIAGTNEDGVLLTLSGPKLESMRIELGSEYIDLGEVEREAEVDDPSDAYQRDRAQADFLQNARPF